MRIAVAAVLCSLLSPLTVPHAAAEPARDASQLVTGDCARARKAGKTCVLDLPAEEVAGDLATAGELAVRIRVFGTATSLIRVRRDFISEIVKTAEDL
jgi:hypothetical protein